MQQQQSIQLAKSSSSAEAASAVYESLLSGRFLERPGRSIFPDFTSNDVLNTLFPARTTAQIATEALDRATEAIERHGVKAIEQAGVYVCDINVSIFDNSENGNVHITGRAVESLKAASVAVSRQRNLFSHNICMDQQLMQLAIMLFLARWIRFCSQGRTMNEWLLLQKIERNIEKNRCYELRLST